MRHLKMAGPLGAASLVVAAPLAFPVTPAYADCEIVSATHGGNWQGEALSMAQALAAKSARDLKAKKGWRGITMKAQQVKPDPFWKTVRPQVSTNIIVGSYVTARTYTTCWTASPCRSSAPPAPKCAGISPLTFERTWLPRPG